MRIYSIGYRRRTTHEFTQTLRENGVRQLVDVRCFPEAEEAGYARGSSLPYLLQPITPQPRYWHCAPLAPTEELVNAYFAENAIPWKEYESGYLALLKQRKVETLLSPAQFSEHACLLCAERDPERCHRRLALEYLQDHWPELEIVHI